MEDRKALVVLKKEYKNAFAAENHHKWQHPKIKTYKLTTLVFLKLTYREKKERKKRTGANLQNKK